MCNAPVMVKWWQLMADFSANWTWLGSLAGLSQGPSRLFAHSATFLEGEHGEALGCPRCWASCPGKTKAEVAACTSFLLT